MDLQKGYMDLILGFIGFTNIQSILIEPTLAAPNESRNSRSRQRAGRNPWRLPSNRCSIVRHRID